MTDPSGRPEIRSFEEAINAARDLATSGRRLILGIVGAPGAGKSTLAAALVRELGGAAVLVPMDGFHLAQSELDRLGRADRKGAPDTFDALGYAALLLRLRDRGRREVVYAPLFRRDLEEPIAGAISIPPDVSLVVTEGNYLLLDEGDWAGVRALIDETWFIAVADEDRIPRLVARHVSTGKSPAAARDWTNGPDQRNAETVAATARRADRFVSAEVVAGIQPLRMEDWVP